MNYEPTKQVCIACDGWGTFFHPDYDARVRCRDCNGTGRVPLDAYDKPAPPKPAASVSLKSLLVALACLAFTLPAFAQDDPPEMKEVDLPGVWWVYEGHQFLGGFDKVPTRKESERRAAKQWPGKNLTVKQAVTYVYAD